MTTEDVEEKAEIYSKLAVNGQQLSVLIDDLLDMSKVEAGKLEIEKLEFNLKRFLRDIESSVVLKAKEKGVSLELICESLLPVDIISDPTRLRQILINLLSNAIKFTPSGGGIKLSICTISGMDRLRFRVVDSGAGMTDEEQTRLFKPFAQADSSTTRKHGGTGLGLYISKRLAKALDGDLTIEHSKVGVGSSFALVIDPGPIIGRETFDCLDINKGDSPNVLPQKFDLDGARVLIVDDSPDNRVLFSLYCRTAGVEHVLAKNGREAVDLALNNDFDLISMDIQMPEMDGNEAMSVLKSRGYKNP